MRRARAMPSGSCRDSHSSLGAEKPGMARQPTMSAKSAKHRWRSAHSADARPSFHNKAGRMGVSAASSKVTPSICPERPMPRTAAMAAGAWLARASRLSTTACHQSCGACSDHSGAGWERASGALAVAADRSSPSMMTALTLDVPMSMPRYIDSAGSAQDAKHGARRDLVDHQDRAQLGAEHAGQDRRLVEPARGDDDRGDVAQHVDGGGDHTAVERMLHGLSPRIEKGPHDVADGPGGTQRIDGDVARQAVADQQRAAAEIADAQQRHVIGGQPLEGLLEHVLVEDGVARARAAGVDRRRQVVALAVDAAGEFAGDLEGVELEPVGQAAHHGIDAELGEIAAAQMADGLAQRRAPADAETA